VFVRQLSEIIWESSNRRNPTFN